MNSHPFRKLLIVCLFVVSISSFAVLHSRENVARPRILGIAGVRIFSSDVPAATEFYRSVTLGKQSKKAPAPCPWCDRDACNVNLASGQVISITPAPKPEPSNLLAAIAFVVPDEPEMKRYLSANKIRAKEVSSSGLGGKYLSVTDPEGHTLLFISGRMNPVAVSGYPRIIHAGFIVKDRAAMDAFYKDLLGFRLYWTGGMKDGVSDWVDMQVPDGTDWIEYMLNVPANAGKDTRGVMDHFAVGVPDVRAAATLLAENGVKRGEEPKIGRDGKYQLNLYDPDHTRVELMEFTPAEKPCCNDYTGPHPKP